jgi:quinol monooxygenase YgiN
LIKIKALGASFKPHLCKCRHKEIAMVKLGLFVRLQAKPGKTEEVVQFLRDALPVVEAEPGTTAWFAIRLGSAFAIFDVFADEAGRQAHLSGKVAAALREKAGQLLDQPPVIEKVDVLAAKLPANR